MKGSKLLKRISAATLAASIFAANTTFDCILAVSNAADTGEQLSDDEVTVAQKSDFSSLLYYYVEKNNDGAKVLKVNDVDSFNRFFNAELNGADAEGTDEEKIPFPEEGIILDEKTENILKITPKFFDEDEAPVITPYKLIKEMTEEETPEEGEVPEAAEGGEEAEAAEEGAEAAEDPFMVEYTIDLAKVNAAAMTLDLSDDEQLSYFIVKEDEGYDVVIPDDYDKLSVVEINDEAVVLDADGEEVTVNLKDAEFNTSLTGFAELRTQDLEPGDTYSVERFCEDDDMPYYYGEVVKITPAEHCKVVIGDDEYIKPVAVEINGDEVDGQEKRFKINLSGNYADQVDVSSDNMRDENGERTFKEGDTVTFSPKNIPDGYKVTLSGGGKSVQSSDLVIENAQGDITVDANREEVKYLGYNNSTPNYVMVKVDGRETYPNPFAAGNDHVTISYDNNIKLRNDVVKVKSITITTADGNSAVVNPEEHTVDNKGLNAYFTGDDSKSFELRRDGIHGDISINVDYEISYDFSFTQTPNSDLVKTVTINNGTKDYTYQDGVIKDENGNEVKLEEALSGSSHKFTFNCDNNFTVNRISYQNSYSGANETSDNGEIAIDTDMRGNNVFSVTLKKAVKKTIVRVVSENDVLGDSLAIQQEDGKPVNMKAGENTIERVDTNKFSFIPKRGYYIKKIDVVAPDLYGKLSNLTGLTAEEQKRIKEEVKNGYKTVYSANGSIEAGEGIPVFDSISISELDCDNDGVIDTVFSYNFGKTDKEWVYRVTVGNVQEDKAYKPVVNPKEDGEKTTVVNGVVALDASKNNTIVFNGKTLSVDDKRGDTYSFVTDKALTIKASDDSLKSYEFYYLDENNVIKKETLTINYYYPKPVIKSIKVKNNTDFLRYLSFGIFGKDSITITVDAENSYPTQAELKDIKLFDSEGNEIEYIEPEPETETDTGNDTDTVKVRDTLSKTWTISVDSKTDAIIKNGVYAVAYSTSNSGIEIKSENMWVKLSGKEMTDKTKGAEREFSGEYGGLDVVNSKFGGIVLENSAKEETNKPTVTLDTENSGQDAASEYLDEANDIRWFSNDNYKWNVSAADKQSGVNNVQYKVVAKKEGDQAVPVVGTEKNNITKKYSDLPELVKDNENDLDADVILDNLRNKFRFDVDSVGTAEDSYCTYTMTAQAEDNSGFKSDEVNKTVGVDKKKPVINAVEMTLPQEASGEIPEYTSGDWTNKPVTIAVSVSDEGSGTDAGKVEIDPKPINGGDQESHNTIEDKGVVDGKHVYIVKPNFEGEITFTVTDNVGNVSEETKVNVKTEDVKPIISNFTFVDAVGQQTDGDETKKEIGQEYDFAITPYGYYFENAVTVSVTSNDPGNIKSGVEKIEYGFIKYEDMVLDAEGKAPLENNLNNISGKTVIPLSDTETIDFVVAAFDGQIVARAYDDAGNSSEWTTPDGVIVETEEMHVENCSAHIQMPDTSYRDRDGVTLYNSAPSFRLAAEDPYSGIREAHWTITDSNGSVLDSGEIDLSQLTVGSNPDETITVDDWTIVKKRNVAVSIEKNITVDTAAQFQKNGMHFDFGFTDNSGFTSAADTRTFSIDTIAPKLISFDVDGTPVNQSYYNKNRTATIKVSERNLDAAKTAELIKVTLENTLGTVASGYTVSQWTNENVSNDEGGEPNYNNVHTMTIVFNADAKYDFEMSVADLAGQRTDGISEKGFIIDKTAPQMSLAFDNNASSNGNYYNAGRKAELTIVEHNFDPNNSMKFDFAAYAEDNVTGVEQKAVIGDGLKWVNKGGDTWAATFTLNKDGKYGFSLAYSDLAGNAGNGIESGTFYIDKTAPVIEQTFTNGRKDKAATNGVFVPKVTFKDFNLPSEVQSASSCTVTIEKIDVNGPSNKKYSATAHTYTSSGKDAQAVYESIFDVFSEIEDNDGIYDVTISAKDLAGNTAEVSHLTVSVNRFGSTYEIVNTEAKNATEKFKNNVPVNTEMNVVVREVNASEITGERNITIVRDNTNRNVLGKDGFKTEDKRTADGDNGWYEVLYTIDKSNFEEDGNYLINIESSDSAGNKNSNNTPVYEGRKCSVAFAIDRTLPEVIISGVEDDAVLKDAEVNLTITCSDRNLFKANDIQSDDLKININDISYDIDSLKQLGASIKTDVSDNIIIELPVKAEGRNSKNEITVEIKDKAGNASAAEDNRIEFELSASFFARHGILAIVLAALGVLILGAGGALIIKKVKS